MADRLLGLRHHAVVGRHDQHGDVGHVGSASTHLGKGFVPRRIDKGDLAPVFRDLVGPDVLGDSTRLAGDHVGADDAVQQRSLSVVDMAQEGHDRRPRAQRLRVVFLLVQLVQDRVFQRCLLAELDFHTEFGRQDLGHLLVQLGIDIQ